MRSLRWTVVLLLYVLSSLVSTWSAQAVVDGDSRAAAAALEALARPRFANLSAAELKLLRGACMRDLVWVGPDADGRNPANDARQGDQWGPERTVRADLIRWLSSDPAANQYVHPSGLGLAAARISGQLDLSFLQIPKPITMLSCFLPDGIDLSNARLQALDLRRSKIGPLNADSAEINGDLTLLYGNYRTISLFRARIAGNLDAAGAHVTNPGQDSIAAMEATIQGDASFHEGFTTDGIVDFSLAKLGRSLSFKDAQFIGDGDNGLDAERATILGSFYWVDVKHTASTILDLENASATALADDRESWPAPGNLDVEGFAYTSIIGGPADAPDRLQWLALQARGYHPQPFQQLAKVLRDQGREGESTDVMIAQREAQRRFGGMNRPERIWSLILQLTIGYGFRPLRALWWIAGFVALGAVLFAFGYRLKVVTPTEAEAYEHFVKTGYAPAHYPPFNPIIYSLENFLPVVELDQGEFWRPNPRHSARGRFHLPGDKFDTGLLPAAFLRWYLWMHILAGWMLTPLLFAGLSGLIRPD